MPPVDSSAFAQAHEALLRNRSIQFDIAPFTPPHTPAWLKLLVEFLRTPLAAYILWTMLAAGALLILFLILSKAGAIRWPGRNHHANDEQQEDWRPEEASARALLEEADALAGRGDYDEAAHLLLFRSIEDIEARRPRLVRPALTSRDIAEAPEIPAAPRNAFGEIAMMVERSLFGGLRLGERDWRHCRAAYEDFAFAEAWN
jgi:hypothetical protein